MVLSSYGVDITYNVIIGARKRATPRPVADQLEKELAEARAELLTLLEIPGLTHAERATRKHRREELNVVCRGWLV